jgi:hypothetical protein
MADLPLGDILPGTHVLRLEAVGNAVDVNVDWLCIAECPSAFKEHDSDLDGMPDHQEALYGTSIWLADTDADGLSDLFELCRWGGFLTHPLDPDTDADGQTDGEEYVAGTNPVDPHSLFKLVTAHAAVSPDSYVLLQWTGTSGHYYEIGFHDGAPSNGAVFLSITNPTAIVFSNGVITYLDDGQGTGAPPIHTSVLQRTYRIRAYAP